jgi:hypothetical protein
MIPVRYLPSDHRDVTAVWAAYGNQLMLIGHVEKRHGLWRPLKRKTNGPNSQPRTAWFGERGEAAQWLLIDAKLAKKNPNNADLTPVLPGFGDWTTEDVVPSERSMSEAAD